MLVFSNYAQTYANTIYKTFERNLICPLAPALPHLLSQDSSAIEQEPRLVGVAENHVYPESYKTGIVCP